MAKNTQLVNSSQIDRLIFHAADANGVKNLQNKVISAATPFSIRVDLNGASEINFFISEIAAVNAIATFNLTAKFYEADGSLISLSTQTVAVPQTNAGVNQYVAITGTTFIANAEYCIITGTLPFTLAYTCSIFAKTLNVIDIAGSITETNSGDILSASQTMVTTTADILSAMGTLNSANYVDGAAFTVSASKTLSTASIVNPTDTLAAGVVGAEAMNEYREKIIAGYDSTANILRFINMFADAERAGWETLTDVTNGADGTYIYPIDMEGFNRLSLFCDVGISTGSVTFDMLGAVQYGTIATAIATYENISTAYLGGTQIVTTAAITDFGGGDGAGIVGNFKFLEFQVVATAAATADWVTYIKKWWE